MFGAGEHSQRLLPHANYGAPTRGKVQEKLKPFPIPNPGGVSLRCRATALCQWGAREHLQDHLI